MLGSGLHDMQMNEKKKVIYEKLKNEVSNKEVIIDKYMSTK